MKINLLRLKELKRNKGRVFMNKKKKELDEIYKDILMSAQVLKKLTVVRDEVIVMIGVKNR